MLAICHANLILLNLIILTMLGEAYKFKAPHYVVFSSHSLLDPNILLSTLFSNTFNICALPLV
jgi:hypothetical protein